MLMPDNYQIPDDPDSGRMDAAYLRTCLGIPTPMEGEMPEFPLAVRQAHFHMSHSLSRMGALGRSGMDATQIATVVALAHMKGPVVVQEETVPDRTFLDDIEDGVELGSKVVVKYRMKEQPGHYVRVEDGKIIVLHDGHERRFKPTSVRLPEDGEFAGVAQSIASVEA